MFVTVRKWLEKALLLTEHSPFCHNGLKASTDEVARYSGTGRLRAAIKACVTITESSSHPRDSEREQVMSAFVYSESRQDERQEIPLYNQEKSLAFDEQTHNFCLLSQVYTNMSLCDKYGNAVVTANSDSCSVMSSCSGDSSTSCGNQFYASQNHVACRTIQGPLQQYQVRLQQSFRGGLVNRLY